MLAKLPVSVLITLLSASFLAALWALYQWMELVLALQGGTLSCSVSEYVDCAAVWMSPVAKMVHQLTGVPIAGWGLIWAVVAYVTSLYLVASYLSDRSIQRGINGVRWVAVVGVITSIGLLGVSIQLGVFCPTCVVTYGLVLGYGGAAWFGLRSPQSSEQTERFLAPSGLLIPSITALCAWGAMLWPGMATPHESQLATLPDNLEAQADQEVASAHPKVSEPGGSSPKAETSSAEHQRASAPASEPPVAPASAPTPQLSSPPLDALINQLPPQGRELLNDTLKALREPPKDMDFDTRPWFGSESASLELIDFSDIRCGHCRNLALTLDELKARHPNSFREQVRWFPLDSDCNSYVPETLKDTTGVKCLGAKALICAEEHPKFSEFRHHLFENQASLSQALLETAAQQYMGWSASELAACAENASVQARLNRDIELARQLDINGTPLLLLNGRKIPAVPLLVYALILADGNPDHPSFDKLQPLN